MNEATDGGTDSRAEEYLVFVLCGRRFAVPLYSIDEVQRIEERFIFRVPAASALYGLANLRGTVAPVLDVRHFLGLEGPLCPANGLVTVLFFMTKNGRVGIAADAHGDVIVPEPSDFSDDGEIVRGTVQNGDFDIKLLDLDVLFESVLLYKSTT